MGESYVAGEKHSTPASQVRVLGCDSSLSGKARYSLCMLDSSTVSIS